jgi:hypothetical protein
LKIKYNGVEAGEILCDFAFIKRKKDRKIRKSFSEDIRLSG